MTSQITWKEPTTRGEERGRGEGGGEEEGGGRGYSGNFRVKLFEQLGGWKFKSIFNCNFRLCINNSCPITLFWTNSEQGTPIFSCHGSIL